MVYELKINKPFSAYILLRRRKNTLVYISTADAYNNAALILILHMRDHYQISKSEEKKVNRCIYESKNHKKTQVFFCK